MVSSLVLAEVEVLDVQKANKNFQWSDSEFELLLSIIFEYKTEKTNEGLYWDSCKKKYTEINDLFVAKLSRITDLPNEEFSIILLNSNRILVKWFEKSNSCKINSLLLLELVGEVVGGDKYLNAMSCVKMCLVVALQLMKYLEGLKPIM